MTFFVEVLSEHLEPQVRSIGDYKTKEEAIAVAHGIIKEFLLREFKPGMNSQALLLLYQERGEHPFIFRDDENTFNVPGYNHTLYAMICAGEICKVRK